MEMRIVFGLLAALANGLFSFSTKVVSEKEINSKIFLFIVYLLGAIGSLFVIVFYEGFHFSWIIFGMAFLMGAGYPIVLKFRFISLKYLSASTYFINYRILSSILLIFLGMWFFEESLSFFQVIGILVGFVVFFLLLERKKKFERVEGLKRGIFYLFVAVVFVSFLGAIAKFNSVFNEYFFSYYLFMFLFGMLSIFVSGFKNFRIKNFKKIDLRECFIWAGFAGFCFFIANVFMYYAYKVGSLAVTYKILSYSLFIPVILSVVVYKEKVGLRKVLAFILTILSIWFFTL